MLRREAARWLARLESEPGPAVERKFQSWYDADPANRKAFDRIRGSYQRAGLLRQSSIYVPVAVENSSARGSSRGTYYAAAAVIAVVAMGTLLFRLNPLTARDTEAVMLKTNIGEIRQVTLGDGSKVTLDTLTSVEVNVQGSHRKARLNYGRARFEVASAKTPFTVEAGDENVTAERGTLDVEHQGSESRIDILAGSSELKAREGEHTRELALEAGDGVLSNSGRSLQTYRLPAGADWTSGMLQFDGTPLVDAVALANRYSDQKLIVDDQLGQLRVTGSFRAGDNANLAKALSAAFKISARQGTDGNWHLSRNKAPGG